MVKITVKIEGMMCGMCEAHINDAVRRAIAPVKVSSSRRKGETVIRSEHPIEEAIITKAISELGYRVREIHTEPYVRKRFFF